MDIVKKIMFSVQHHGCSSAGRGEKAIALKLLLFELRRKDTIAPHDPLECLALKTAFGSGIGDISAMPGQEMIEVVDGKAF
jgi:hypothetical protein